MSCIGLGRLEPLLLAQVAALAEVRRAHRVGDPVVLAVEVLELARRLVDVVLAERADQLVHRAQQVLRVERRGHERIEVREIGRAARGERGEELGVEVAPAERLLAHLEARDLALELGDARLLDDLDGLRLDFGVPDLKLAHLLADRRGRAPERDGARGPRRCRPGSDDGRREMQMRACGPSELLLPWCLRWPFRKCPCLPRTLPSLLGSRRVSSARLARYGAAPGGSADVWTSISCERHAWCRGVPAHRCMGN